MKNTSNYKNKKIGVFMGGISREREISLRSGSQVLKALQKLGYDCVKIDPKEDLLKQITQHQVEVAYLALHGRGGEDGQVQGFLESMNIPYTGSGVMASAITMNKILTKMILKSYRLPTPAFQMIQDPHQTIDIEFPLVIKPALEGSSFGISIHKNKESYESQIAKDFKNFDHLFVEEFVDGLEVTVGIIGVGDKTRALPVLQLVPKNAFYDFEAKYTQGKTDFILPAQIEPTVTDQIQNLALRAHELCGCYGLSRVDMILAKGIYPFITEINSIPGMTELSDLPAMAGAAGISFEALVEEILNSAGLKK
jgi:D-alanine-D-alanine ligase